jgi:hypothetical protein
MFEGFFALENLFEVLITIKTLAIPQIAAHAHAT